MRYIMYFFVLFALLAFLQPAQAVQEKQDTTLRIAASTLSRLGDNLIVSMQIDVTRKVPSNQSVILIPSLQDSIGNFIRFPEIHINGRKQQIIYQRENAGQEGKHEVLRRKNGTLQTIRYLRSVPFSPWMNHSGLSLIEEACGCGITWNNDSTFVTLLDIPTEIQPRLAFFTPTVEVLKQREESGSAYLDFPVNEAVIYDDYRNNAAELKKIMQSINLIRNDTNVYISKIHIHGYASPEGPYEINNRLARERTRALKEYVGNQSAFGDTLFTTQYTAEDWGGLLNMLTDTLFDQQKELLHIANSAISPELKEQMMRKQHPQFFDYMLKNWFPALRHSDYTIHYIVRPFTLEQAKEVLQTQPRNLSIEEMFRLSQTYPVGSAAYNEVFLTAVRLNPDHPVANLNAACIMLMKKEIAQAESYLTKAMECPEKALAVGVLHLLKGEYDTAVTKLREAEAAGLEQATDNLRFMDMFYKLN